MFIKDLKELEKYLLNVINFTFGSVVLGVTLFFVILLMNGFTEMVFVPWDTTSVELRPEIGTLERSVNDFFEAGIGSKLLSIILIGGSFLIFIFRFKKEAQKDQLLYLFAFLNFLFFLAVVFSMFVGHYMINAGFFGEGDGYQGVWPSAVILFISYIALFWAQIKIPTRQAKNKY